MRRPINTLEGVFTKCSFEHAEILGLMHLERVQFIALPQSLYLGLGQNDTASCLLCAESAAHAETSALPRMLQITRAGSSDFRAWRYASSFE